MQDLFFAVNGLQNLQEITPVVQITHSQLVALLKVFQGFRWTVLGNGFLFKKYRKKESKVFLLLLKPSPKRKA